MSIRCTAAGRFFHLLRDLGFVDDDGAYKSKGLLAVIFFMDLSKYLFGIILNRLRPLRFGYRSVCYANSKFNWVYCALFFNISVIIFQK